MNVMYKNATIFYLQTVTPTHVGSGQDLGIVDLPIQRETHTGYPKIEGSSLKGSLREAFEHIVDDDIKIHLTFGFDESNATETAKDIFKDKAEQFAGALGFTDAKILLFPVKSVKGVYAYITCPDVLRKFQRDLEIVGIRKNFEIPTENSITSESKVKLDNENVVILEEYSFQVSPEADAVADFLAVETGVGNIKEKLVVLSDDDFKDFVKMFTEVITRTKIDNTTGTVQEGALFTEEYLPAETILYSFALTSPVMAPIDDKHGLDDETSVLEFFRTNCPKVFQIGGNATIGKGICKIVTK
jgi:CRISPR-associated protein Cmr4